MSTLLATITQHNCRIECLYDRLLNTHANIDTKIRYRNHLVHALARHLLAEEVVVYPAFRHYLSSKDGKAVVNRYQKRGERIAKQLRKLQRISVLSSAELISTTDSLMDEFMTHSRELERDDLPRLEQNLTSTEGELLAMSFVNVKSTTTPRSEEGDRIQSFPCMTTTTTTTTTTQQAKSTLSLSEMVIDVFRLAHRSRTSSDLSSSRDAVTEDLSSCKIENF